MRDDYKAARKLGEEAVKEAKRKGIDPYLPILDEIEGVTHSLKEVRLGLVELPIRRIVGNKEAGRNSAFANNFMPLLEDGSEFAIKWSNLYDSFLQEGIRDAIKCYEYMGNYYVQEGNKRVSVARFGDMEFILADVYRILPQKSDSDEYKAYCEYMDFYDCTKNCYIVFKEAGEYPKLADLLGQDLDKPWPESLCSDLKWAYFSFCKKCSAVLGIKDDRELSEAFLMYISIFPMETLCRDTEEQVIKNIKQASPELLASKSTDSISFLDSAPEAQTSVFKRKLFSGRKKYTSSSPLRAAFIYDAQTDDSRWIDSHEAGRLYVDKMTGDNVVTASYIGIDGNVSEAIQRAVDDKNEIIFAVSPTMISEALKAAVRNPNVKFICCSVGEVHASLRYYHGKLYEASFLMGILAADTLLRDGAAGERRIGYLARTAENFSIRDLNAFAVGVSLIDPDCRISLKYSADGSDTAYRDEWLAEGVSIYADFDYQTAAGISNRAGLFRIKDTKDEYLGAPYFSWGKYYVQIVQSVLSGAWDIGVQYNMNSAASYWFGLSTGVVDIRLFKPDYRTVKMLAFFKNSIVNGGFDPFTGELHTRDGAVLQEDESIKSGVSVERKTMKAGEIAFMHWLNDNIDGELPPKGKS